MGAQLLSSSDLPSPVLDVGAFAFSDGPAVGELPPVQSGLMAPGSLEHAPTSLPACGDSSAGCSTPTLDFAPLPEVPSALASSLPAVMSCGVVPRADPSPPALRRDLCQGVHHPEVSTDAPSVLAGVTPLVENGPPSTLPATVPHSSTVHPSSAAIPGLASKPAHIASMSNNLAPAPVVPSLSALQPPHVILGLRADHRDEAPPPPSVTLAVRASSTPVVILAPFTSHHRPPAAHTCAFPATPCSLPPTTSSSLFHWSL